VLIEALKREGAGDILVVVGGVIPPKDYEFLKKAGGQRRLRARQHQHPASRVRDSRIDQKPSPRGVK